MTTSPGDGEQPQDPYQQPAGGSSSLPPYGQPPDEQQPQYGQPQYGAQPTYGQPTYGQPQYGQPRYGQPQYGQPAYGGPPAGYPQAASAPTDGRATAAMIVGIVSLVLMCGYGVGLLGSPVAWWLGQTSVRTIDASNGQLSGRGMAQAGKILGIIGTVLLVLLIVAVVVVVVVIAAHTTTSP